MMTDSSSSMSTEDSGHRPVRQSPLHQRLGSAAVRTKDVVTRNEEATTDERRAALVAEETICMPVTIVKRNELGRTKT